jgi:hypothetical protein
MAVEKLNPLCLTGDQLSTCDLTPKQEGRGTRVMLIYEALPEQPLRIRSQERKETGMREASNRGPWRELMLELRGTYAACTPRVTLEEQLLASYQQNQSTARIDIDRCIFNFSPVVRSLPFSRNGNP